MRVVAAIGRVQLFVAMVALVVMGAVTVTDVVLKYTMNRPVTGAYDLVESLLPIVVFNGLPVTLLRRQTIVIDLVDHLAGPGRTRLLVACADVAALAMLGLILAAMVSPALQALDYGDRKIELGLAIWVIWVGVLLGVAGCVLAAATLVLRRPLPNPPA